MSRFTKYAVPIEMPRGKYCWKGTKGDPCCKYLIINESKDEFMCHIGYLSPERSNDHSKYINKAYSCRQLGTSYTYYKPPENFDKMLREIK